ncbi:hypothetical protein XELAEV_18028736mg [Xenopus laevis]|uniref:Uncharacterized protein n=1 Tax=Xenopus laevis TaxID=8355 RepID=A0A974HGZ2_XENLA|nr:hypothetical protein XELAEV_18028736mg [Xenopus laevis]
MTTKCSAHSFTPPTNSVTTPSPTGPPPPHSKGWLMTDKLHPPPPRLHISPAVEHVQLVCKLNKPSLCYLDKAS